MRTNYVKSLHALLWLVTFTACSPAFRAAQIDPQLIKNSQYTGAVDPKTQAPYTGTSPSTSLQDLKNQGQNAEGNYSLPLSIQDFTINVSKSSNVTRFEAKVLFKRIESHLPDGEFEFVGTTKNPLAVLSVASKADSRLQVDLKCLDKACELASAKFTWSDQGIKSTANVLRRERIANIQWQGNKNLLQSLPNSERLSLFNTKQVRALTKEVSFGFSKLLIGFQDSFCLLSDLIDTTVSEKSAQLGCSPGIEKLLDIELVGNTNVGQWLFRVINLKGAEQAPLFLQVATSLDFKPEALKPVTALPQGTSNPSVGSNATNVSPVTNMNKNLPIYLGPIKLDPINPVSRSFELGRSSYDHTKKIENQINEWMKGPYKSRLQTYLNNLFPRLGEILPGFDQAKVPHQMMFVTLWESEYFTAPGYPVLIGSAGEVGPWQIMAGTAKDRHVQLKIFNLVQSAGRAASHPCDERAQLKKSSTAIANYWNWLLSSFPADPELAILSYNWGIGNVSNKLSSCQDRPGQSCADKKRSIVSAAQKAGYNFWVMDTYRMIPEGPSSYVFKMLAAYHIFKNYKNYGLKIPEYKPQPQLEKWGANCSK